jgi:hypothetical protein
MVSLARPERFVEGERRGREREQEEQDKERLAASPLARILANVA